MGTPVEGTPPPFQMSLSLGDSAGEIGSDDGDRDEPAGDRSGSQLFRDVVAERLPVAEAPTAADHTAPKCRFQGLSTGGPGLGGGPRRGKPSEPLLPSGAATEVLALITADYADFGPTPAPARSSPSGAASIWVSRRSGAG